MVFRPTTFGKYVLLKRIAIGGMAEVFRAKAFGAEGFEKLAAVKRMLPHLSADAQFVEMFINEAKLAANLNHANIVQIYDFGCIDKLYFISMEYVHGKDIADIIRILRERNLSAPIEMACHVFIEVLNGLDYAHRLSDAYGNPLGLIHRDMSPHNIIVSYEGEVKLVDFGIAKATSSTVHTTGGVLKGKYSYMSPEQAHGLHLDHRSDLFSLAICFYELLTQSKMFHAESDLGVLEKVRETEFVPPRQIDPSIPRELEDILLRALEKNPQDRYESAAEFRDQLEQFMFSRNLHYSTSWLAGFMREIFSEQLAQEGEDFAEEADMVQRLRSEARRFARLTEDQIGPDTVVLHKTPSAPGQQQAPVVEDDDEEDDVDTVAETREVELPQPPGWQPVEQPPSPGPLVVSDDDVISVEEIEQFPVGDEEYLETAKMSRPDQKLFEKVAGDFSVSSATGRPPIREVAGPAIEDTLREGELNATTDRRGRAHLFDVSDSSVTGPRTGEHPLLEYDFEKDRSTLSEDGRQGAPLVSATEKSALLLAGEEKGFPFGKLFVVLLVAVLGGGLIAYFAYQKEEPAAPAKDAADLTATRKLPRVSPRPATASVSARPEPVVDTVADRKEKQPERQEKEPAAAAGTEAATTPATSTPKPPPAERPAASDAGSKPVVAKSKPRSTKPRVRSGKSKVRKKHPSSKRRRSRPRRKKRRSSVAASRGEPATVTVGLTDGWANVYIDGKMIRTTPLIKYKVAPGRHTIELRDRTGKLIKRQKIRARSGADLRFVW